MKIVRAGLTVAEALAQELRNAKADCSTDARRSCSDDCELLHIDFANIARMDARQAYAAAILCATAYACWGAAVELHSIYGFWFGVFEPWRPETGRNFGANFWGRR